jgi:hypothetical protein
MKKALLGLFIITLYCSCDSTDYYFREKASGHRAFGLDGIYVFTYDNGDSTTRSDTLQFQRMDKNDFMITDFSSKETIFYGEILKRKGLYFTNRPARKKGWWHISAFKFSGDSVYNYWGVRGGSTYYDEIKEQKLFSDFKETDTSFYINNSSLETYKAMESVVMKGDRAAYRMLEPDENRKISQPEAVSRNEASYLVYPNPVKDNLIIESKSDGKYSVELIDINGNAVQSENFYENYFSMNIKTIPNGNYIARITSNGKQNNFKIVVAK